jgi:uncharacterized protein
MTPQNNSVANRRTKSDSVTDKYLKSLPAGHIIHTLYSEHKILMTLLDDIDKLRKKILKLNTPINNPEYFVKLINKTKILVEVDTHHKREEEVLFPELEKRGVYQYHPVLRSEHNFLIDYKYNFLKFIEDLGNIDFESYKTQMNFQANGIIGIMREHAFRENHFVYPVALDIIKEKEVWLEMETKSKEIGYNFFIPISK